MNIVLADAFYYIARLNHRDQYHDDVVAFSKTFRAKTITTDLILVEVADALAKSDCRMRVPDLIQRVRDSSEVIPASRDLLDRAMNLYRQHQDKDWTLTDCASFVVMRERGITSALTGDKHFEQAGFKALLK